MKKNRVLASIVLTAGLGLSGVTAATASDTAPAQPDHGKARFTCVIVHKKGHEGSSKPEKIKIEFKDGKYYLNGKQVPKGKLPAKCPPRPPLPGHGKGKVICRIHKEGDAERGKAERSFVERADGTLRVGGRQIPKDKLPHGGVITCDKLPGGGKDDHVCVIIHEKGGAELRKDGEIIAKRADGPTRVAGKQIPKDKLPEKCPPRLPAPPEPGKGPGEAAGKGASVAGTAVRTAGAVVTTAVGLLG